MRNKAIIVVNGEPNSIFLEIFFKSLKKKKYNSPLILITSLELLIYYMKKFNYKSKINIIDYKNIKKSKLYKNAINLINLKYKFNTNSKEISSKSNQFIKKSFVVGFKILESLNTYKFLNGPISKKNFLNKKYPGITEYIADKTDTKKVAMLIYNDKLAVCPLTTHIPIKKISKYITKRNIIDKTNLINEFYKKYRNIKPKIAVLGLNPHCESTDNFNEDDKILKPAIKYLKKLRFNISGPYSADTIFLKKNRQQFDVIIGMYHDQVLTPMKTLFEYNAINLTLGLPFIRVSPDHGPNEKMIGKNISNPLSLIKAIEFLDKN